MSTSLLPTNWSALPTNLPIPIDDGLADHLPSTDIPLDIVLSATTGPSIDLHNLSLQRPILLFIYPRTGQPGVPNPDGWDDIPGARGCTPELCAVRDSVTTLSSLSPTIAIFGMSTQSTQYQSEVAERLHLPYPILSDASLSFTNALKLPTFEANGEILLKRITILIENGKVSKVDYPVFPSDQAAKRAEGMLSS